MSKYVILSFDDGRSDTYINAVPIMDKYSIIATINVTTDFVLHPESNYSFKSADNKAMTIDQVLELYKKGYEIASHGNKHINDPDDVKESLDILHNWGVSNVYGFASPSSEVTENNYKDFAYLIDNGSLKYIRSGTQTRREGIFYAAITVFNRVFRSRKIFSFLNKRNLMNINQLPILLKTVAITRYTTVDQITSFLEKIHDNEIAILMFHSILTQSPQIKDSWYWLSKDFDKLCQWLSDQDTITVCDTKSLFYKNHEEF